jgi:hypothetical protein
MAIIANCRQPDSDYILVDRITALAPNRFPVPNSARGFCIEPSNYDTEESAVAYPIIAVKTPPAFHQGVLVSPETEYLEPTTGQIWPR